MEPTEEQKKIIDLDEDTIVIANPGTGKTTTAGKMAAQFKNQGKTVLLSACDTFRAAAIEQLEVWADRAGVKIVSAEKGSDPAALAYKSLVKAIDEKIDVLMKKAYPPTRFSPKQTVIDISIQVRSQSAISENDRAHARLARKTRRRRRRRTPRTPR